MKKINTVLCVLLLFSAVGWFFSLHFTVLASGYLDAGDDHVHVAYANETRKIWAEEGRFLGWSRLYGMGAPIFLLRPPGFYSIANVIRAITCVSMEQALKICVILGFCLFPLAVYTGARMMEMSVPSSTAAGLMSVLGISMWGHTVDAYQYLGVHKQLFAIFVFPMAMGALWQALCRQRYGLLLALLFSAMFLTHPYIAYCFAMAAGCLVISLPAHKDWSEVVKGVGYTFLWAVPAILITSIWLVPFVTSPEMQVIDPYLSRRYYFEVTGCTTAETLRQYFLGGILDTTFYAGPFGGTEWVSGSEWGWRNNGAWPRFPLLTLFSFIGLCMAVFRPENLKRRFLALVFLLSFILLAGPDDFFIIDWIPFAKKFQNIHAIFMFEWAAFLLGAMAITDLSGQISRMHRRKWRAAFLGALAAILIFGFGTAFHERSKTIEALATLRNMTTQNGELLLKKNTDPLWLTFNQVVRRIDADPTPGNITGFPQVNEDSVLYNLLPHMVNRAVSITGFETLGGVYYLMLHHIRTDLRNNYPLQQLFNIRFVVNSPYFRERDIKWHSHAHTLYRDKFWELLKIDGDFGKLQPLSHQFVGFLGSEREWQAVMVAWVKQKGKENQALPWLINFTHAGLQPQDMARIKPYLYHILLGKTADVPELLVDIATSELPEGGSIRQPDRFFNHLAPAATAPQSLEEEKITWEILQDNRQGLKCRTQAARETPLMCKQAFYRGWQATLDGETVPIYRISPGLQMVLLPKGSHELEWTYTGPNHWTAAVRLFYAGFLLALLLWFWQYKHRQPAEPAGWIPVKKAVLSSRIWSWFLNGVWGGFFLVICFQTVSETGFKKPVLIHPQNGQVLDREKKRIFWNYVTGIPAGRQVFQVEVATDPDFENIIRTDTVQGVELKLDLDDNDRKTYFYRIRLEVDGKTYPWTSPEKIALWPK